MLTNMWPAGQVMRNYEEIVAQSLLHMQNMLHKVCLCVTTKTGKVYFIFECIKFRKVAFLRLCFSELTFIADTTSVVDKANQQ